MDNRYTISPIDGLQPQAVEIEKAVIGVILIESKAYQRASEMLVPEDFYSPKHVAVYRAAETLYNARKPIDMLTICSELEAMGEIEAIGGAYAIAEIARGVTSSSHLEHHCLIVKEAAVKRGVIELMQGAIAKIRQGEDIGDVLFDASRGMDAAQEALIGKSDTQHIATSIMEAREDMYRRKQLATSGQATGISTGIADLNRRINGWQRSELVVVAARPAMGKTAIALHFAKSAAKSGTPVAIFSLEMSNISLANRLLLSECDVDADKFKSGYLSRGEMQNIEAAAVNVSDMPIYVDDNPSVTMGYIRSKCRVLKKQGKCELVIIDYLQLASESKDKNRNREQEISLMSREAKIIAKEMDIPVLLLSQLNRGVEARADKKPMLSDLRESGAIEQDADMVMFIHRPQYYGMTVQSKGGGVEENYGELIIAKNRNGATGLVKFKHNDSMTQIYDYEGIRQERPAPSKPLYGSPTGSPLPF